MNAPISPIKEATKVVSRDWHAVLRPFMGRREPVLGRDGRPLMYASAGLARAAAGGHKGGSDLFICRSPVEPTLEQIREIANQDHGIGGTGLVSFAIDDMDTWACARRSPYRHGGR